MPVRFQMVLALWMLSACGVQQYGGTPVTFVGSVTVSTANATICADFTVSADEKETNVDLARSNLSGMEGYSVAPCNQKGIQASCYANFEQVDFLVRSKSYLTKADKVGMDEFKEDCYANSGTLL